MSTLLFFGPGAEQESLNQSHKIGRLLGTFGADGLKTEEAREVVGLLTHPPIGDIKGVVLIGPMDTAQPKASDVLLKSLEEFDASIVQPILWAEDIGNVTPTIRSRCHATWCFCKTETPEDLQVASMNILEAYVAKDVVAMVNVLKEHKKNLRDLVDVVILFISQNITKNHHFDDLWFVLRNLLSNTEPSYAETLVAFLPKRIS